MHAARIGVRSSNFDDDIFIERPPRAPKLRFGDDLFIERPPKQTKDRRQWMSDEEKAADEARRQCFMEMRKLGQKLQWEQAAECFKSMQPRQLQPIVLSYNGLVDALRLGQQWQWALLTAVTLMYGKFGVEADIYGWSQGISSCEKIGNWEPVMELFGATRQGGLQPNLVTYSGAVNTCTKAFQWTSATWMLHCAGRRNGLQHDTVACNAAISAAGEGEKWEQALAMAAEQLVNGLVPSLVTENAVASAFEKSSDWQRGLCLLRRLQKDDSPRKPDEITYSAVVSACERRGQWQHALIVFQEMNEAKLKPDVVLCSAFVSACAKGAAWEAALGTLEEASNVALQPNVVSFSAALMACEHGEQWGTGLRMRSRTYLESMGKRYLSFLRTLSTRKPR
eukprot:TRINITY_DN18294_c0_g1_i2.p1 TRINITY_DN18294_c0_g1~~TRINITY_DN18294_c0_g1_i2.p1  ORF type:complete len:395 (-),score=85.06 TRINITY_DN18294_c0_g1_i2:585-1769(-)